MGLSIILGPLCLLPAMCIYGLIYPVFGPNEYMGYWDTFLLFAAYGYIGLYIAYPATVILGLPAALALHYWNLFKLPIVATVSVIPSLIIFSFYMPSISNILLYGYASISVAVGCWFVYKWVK